MRPISFLSTRSAESSISPVSIEEAIVAGLAPDGGLYVPDRLPALPARVMESGLLEYSELAYLILEPFFPGWTGSGGALYAILRRAYGPGSSASGFGPRFSRPEVAHISKLDGIEAPAIAASPGGAGSADLYLIELFHGPTCAFKDLALSVLGGLLKESLDRLGRFEPVLVLTATSGDTGSAALAGLGGIEGVRTAVIFPEGGTSEIQRLQMTSLAGPGRFVASIRGNFDDAQRAAKAIFGKALAGEGALAGQFLSSANSINIGRLLPQIVYYVAAWRHLAASGALGRDGKMDVAVPTGNFGDILAAKYAKEMGLPIGRLILASNANKVLAEFFGTGVYDRRRSLVRTKSPSMDILVSSNLERLLHMASGASGARVSKLMSELATEGRFEVSVSERAYMADFIAGWCADAEAQAAIASVWEACGVLVDPHTATAIRVALEAGGEGRPIVVAGTASPFKFPAACLEALGMDVRDLGHGDSGDLGL
ncbi:MAG TPA: threonine synthase, partial [Rectinemataceae bacterium]